ncbi:MAG: carboxypeptidase-like regulatory domain-containing protein [Ginsengibacter sp.]|jgi:hypothetical protein
MRSVNRFLLLSFLLLPSLSSFTQGVFIKGVIYSKGGKLPVSYATIQLSGTKNIIDSDENGYFEIFANSEKDSLLITCIGFKSYTIPVRYFKDTDSVFLEENFLKMDEVHIKNPVLKTFGIVNEKMGSSRIGGTSAGRSELTTLIEIPTSIESYYISKVFIRGKRFREENPVRLHIYAVNENGLPGEELLKKQVIIAKQFFDTKNNIITIDVKDQNILLENVSFFVGIEWITSIKVKFGTGPEIIQTDKASKLLSYYRPFPGYNNSWYAHYSKNGGLLIYENGELPGIVTSPTKGNPLNMCASAEIIAFY